MSRSAIDSHFTSARIVCIAANDTYVTCEAGVCCGSLANTRSVSRLALQHRTSPLHCIGGTHQLSMQSPGRWKRPPSRAPGAYQHRPARLQLNPSLRGPSAQRRPGRGHRRGRRDRSLANRGHNTAPAGRPARRSCARGRNESDSYTYINNTTHSSLYVVNSSY